MKNHNIIKSGLLMFAFALVCTFLISLINNQTQDKIMFNEQQLLIQRLNDIVSDYDNNIVDESYKKNVYLHGLQQDIKIFPAKKNNEIFAYLVEHTYPKGYSGDIKILTGFNIKGEILGTRVITHKETPGLGDKIETRKSDWIKVFSGLSFANLDKSKWKVKRDGGVFDQFTGATITPRAIVTAAYEILEYFEKNLMI